MSLSNSKHLILILLGLIVSTNLSAQAQFSMHLDTGENNVSDGLFVKASGFGAYRFGKTKVVGGCQFDSFSFEMSPS